jgi:hypothetical protein
MRAYHPSIQIMKKDKRKELCLTNEERQTYDSQTKSDLLLLAVINLP